MPLQMIRDFLRQQAAGGILLVIAAALALIMENSPLHTIYDALLSTPVAVQVGALKLHKPLLLWINDGMMAVFFLLVGVEIKREVLEGQLSNREQISLPALAALGGLAVPALIYVLVNMNDTVALSGWAIPSATDIAFALGVMTLLGNRIPESLKITLVAIAIIDDLAAIIIIALFYTDNLSYEALLYGSIAIALLFALRWRGVMQITPYILVGIMLWVCVLKSGIHATLAGVIVAMFIPLKHSNPDKPSPLRHVEHSLHPWVAFAILPIFAFANAGVPLSGLSLDMLLHPITLGVAAGLFVGKQMGVMAITALGVATGLCRLPKGVNWRQYYGMSVLTGIGFTMSLFIGTLAFENQDNLSFVRLGVLIGSILSATIGYVILRNSTNIKAS
jgi:NhaA family Na+:H+ antiporter